jgi:hypothetical protein
MKSRSWQEHAREVLNARLDHTTSVYGPPAVHRLTAFHHLNWAHDAKSLIKMRAQSYKRMGSSIAERTFPLWTTLAAK